MKDLALKILLVAASSTLSAALFEGAYRVIHFRGGEEELSTVEAPKGGKVTLRTLIKRSEESQIVYELKPNLKLSFQGVTVSTNSAGLRSPEITAEKPSGVKRIIGLGDSIMFGWGVEDDETYLRIVEKELRDGGRSVEVLNFGVPGYNSAMEASTFLTRALQYSPDAVILHFVNNDFDVPYFMLKPADPWALDRSYLWEFVKSRISPSAKGDDELVGMDMRGVERGDRSEVLQQYESMTGRAGAQQALELIATETTRLQIPLFIVYGTATSEQQELLKDVSEKFGATLLPVRPAVERFFAGKTVTKEDRMKALQLSSGDPHPNATGHRLYAETVMEGIMSDDRLFDSSVGAGPPGLHNR